MNVNHYEPMTMVAAQVMGNHVAINHCLSMGNFKFNALKPLIIKNVLNSIYILSDVSYSLMGHLLGDIELKKDTSTTSTQSANLGLSSSN
jgi:fumarate hydratase class II